MRKFCPVGFSLGITLWQVEQGSPVCWLNTGIASVFSGATIAGKAVCEYFCFSGGSHTSSTGPVHNPR
ncbi:MAG: hypothetical protein E8D49_02235, partial [Nitrospira sp.]